MAKGKKETGKRDLFKVSSQGTIERKLRNCPRCGPGIFMAKHSNRESCGKCGYTELLKK